MDTQAYLMRHGWSGPGNPLNPNQRPGPHGGLGLTKPILVARKQNNHGVGKKTTKDPTNQWWLRGFEDALKGVGDESPAAVSAKNNNALTSELYRFFVRGEGLAGTLDREKKGDAMGLKSLSKSKRKRDSEGEGVEGRKAKKEEKAARKEERRKRRKTKEIEGLDLTSSSDTSDKRKEGKEERRLRKKEKKEKKGKRSEEDYPTPMSTEQELEPTRPKGKKSEKEKREDGKSKKESKDKEKSDAKKRSKKDRKENS